MNTLVEQLGKYELREQLGRGGMAEVWKAFDTQLRRCVAIKMLHADLLADPDFMTRFEQEAQVVASLRHPNIIQIYDFQFSHPCESDRPRAYMVMEYVEGQTLTDYIKSTSHQGTYPPVGDILFLFTSISQAIDYAHQHGMIHRDIKPSNILLHKSSTLRNPMGEPILTDFGIAKLVGTPSSALTRRTLGTAHYISPEQGRGHSGNERSDLYSLGVILYEICTGVRPFGGENEVAIIMQHISAMPTPPILINPHIPHALNEVILRSLAKDPKKRFSSASAMTAAIAAAFNMPVPEELSPAANLPDAVTGPTDPQPLQPNLPLDVQPASTGGEGTSKIVVDRSSRSSPMASPAQYSSATASWWAHLRLTQGWVPRIVVMVMLVILLVGSGLAYAFFTRGQAPGGFSFLSSGQFNGNSDQGINDELQIDLHGIADPAPGKSYYGWLVVNSIQIEAGSLLLGKLTPGHGILHFLYSDRQHTNLLAHYSDLLITEEDTSSPPTVPSPDPSTRRYLAQIPQIPDPKNVKHFSLLDHLRHLLAADPELKGVGLPGGLDIWLYRNTGEILDLAGRARDDWRGHQADDMHNQIVRMLDYLDGNALVHRDLLPDASPPMSALDRHDARIGLLGGQNDEPPGYLSHISTHLNGFTQAPGTTSETIQKAGQIDRNINQVRHWLEQVRKDAMLLIKMNDAQLLTQASQPILNDLEAQADSAYHGQLNQSTSEVQQGVSQIYRDIQGLATFDVIPYPSS